MTKIGLIGTGLLGKAVGLHLLESGYGLTVFNRTKKKTVDLVKRGATIASSPKEVAKSCNLVIIVVTDANAVEQISFGPNGLIEGVHEDLVVADMSTVNPNESIKISKQFETKGIVMLGIPVMGGPNVAISGNLVMMADGMEPVFIKHKKVFQTIAKETFFLGKNGTAHSVKLAMNLQIAMLALALSEGITLTRGGSVDPQIFLKILNSTYFKTGMSENKAYKMIQGKFEPTFTLANLKKDLKTINETAKSFGLNLAMSTQAEEIYQNALNDGYGSLDYTGILAYLEEFSRSESIKKK